MGSWLRKSIPEFCLVSKSLTGDEGEVRAHTISTTQEVKLERSSTWSDGLMHRSIAEGLTVQKIEKSIPDSIGNTEYKCHNYKIPNTEIMKIIFTSSMEYQ